MRRFWRQLRERLGWIDCPQCGEFRRARWVKDWIFDPEEPPCFGHWYMPCCGARTETSATMIMDDAARQQGFRNFDDFAEQRLPVSPDKEAR